LAAALLFAIDQNCYFYRMEETGFKFEPIWVTALGVLTLFLVYKFCVIVVDPNFKFDYLLIILALTPLLMSWLIMPMFFRMLFGTPAILLTADQLVDNVMGISIDWKDIQDIRITGVSKPFLSIILKNKKEFFQNIQNPLKRTLLRIFFSISPGDISMNLAMVAGDNEAVRSVVMVYWSRYYGHFD
jgi:hypothetical protein